MAALWSLFIASCKSRCSAIARSLFLGRERARQKIRELRQRVNVLREKEKQSQARVEQLEADIRQLHEQLHAAQAKLSQPQPLNLPIGDVVPGQQFPVGIVVLCVKLARAVGLRRTVATLEIVFAWLNVSQRVPTYQTIRGWMQRIGLDRMQNAKEIAGGVWLTDHSNQIGKDKVLTILRVRDWQPGTALRLENVDILTLEPSQHCKCENVATTYQATALRCGVPRVVATDGAVELREPVETLGNPKKRPLTLRDPKHFLANQLEALLKRDPQWEAFTKQLGGARVALQQTELAHFVPPGLKAKARFMNLEPTLKWASAILWHLENPASLSRQGVTADRMTEKLGWLATFASDLQQWQACQAIVGAALTFLNREGISQGVADRFREQVAGQARGWMSQELQSRTETFLREHEGKLEPGECVPMSTEIVESAFGKYKQFERQHSKGGFTGLLLTFPVLLRETTDAEVLTSFGRVKVADVKKWQKDHLGQTLTAKRQLMFREAKPKARKKTKNSATPIRAAA